MSSIYLFGWCLRIRDCYCLCGKLFWLTTKDFFSVLWVVQWDSVWASQSFNFIYRQCNCFCCLILLLQVQYLCTFVFKEWSERHFISLCMTKHQCFVIRCGVNVTLLNVNMIVFHHTAWVWSCRCALEYLLKKNRNLAVKSTSLSTNTVHLWR